MALTNDLIRQFVAATNDNVKAKNESTVYGTIVESDGSMYVRIDGSDQLTPISTTTSVYNGERVTVLIKNHTAIVTGNISAPSVSSTDVEETNKKILEFEIAIGNKVDTEELNAERARIDSLVTDNVLVKEKLLAAEGDIDTLQTNDLNVRERLTAAEASIKDLDVTKLDVEVANAKFATIESLSASNADIYNLNATYATFVNTTTDRLNANDASISNLQANKLDATTANITYAKIVDLENESARINALEAGVADIDTLIFGSATGSTIQTSFANAVIAQLGDAQIKSAMIESISASKITAGDIITNNVRVRSEDGSLNISDETIQISDSTRVRVQIGKDASDDYSINIWDQNGNLMFSEGGITDSAIKGKIIRDDMVSDTANIAAHKLDIDSLFEEINGSTNTIKSTKVYLDEEKQTLDVAFKAMSTDVSELGETVTSQGTTISVIQGQISSKIWQQDINTATGEMNTKYSTLQQDLSGLSATVASHTTTINQKADSSTVTTLNTKVTTLESNLSGFKSTVSNTYATKTDLSNVKIGGRNLYEKSGELTASALQYYSCPSRTVTIEDDATVPSGKCLKIAMDEFEGSFLGGPYLTASFGKQIPKLIKGETYTVSVWAKCSTAKTVGVMAVEFLSGLSSTIPNLSTEWQRYVITGTYNGNTDKSVAITFYYASHWTSGDVFYISSPMVEYGNKASDWGPAPEDLATVTELSNLGSRVTNAETRITQTTNDISSVASRTSTLESRVTSAETKVTQNANSITAVASRTTTNESAIAALELKADGLTVRLGDAESDISAAQSTADTAKTNAATAQSTANTANSTANTALTNTKLQSDVTNYAQLNDDTASYWGFTADNTADGHWYTMNVLSRDKFISGWHKCKGGESFKVTFEISTSFKGNSTNGGTDSVYRGTAIGLYGYNDAGTSVGISYSTRITASADAPATTVSCIVRVSSSARKFRVFVQTESYANFSGSVKIRNVRVDKIDEEASKTATNYLSFSSSGLVVGDMTAGALGKNVLIDSDSVDIRTGTTTLASFGADTIYLGKNSETAVINLCNGSATMRSVDDSDFKIYTDKRLVMSAYSSALLDCWRDSTHMTRISMQSADPDASYMWGGIFHTVYQDTIKNTFDMSGNTTEFKIIKDTTEASFDLNETRLRVQGNNMQVNCTNGLYVGYDGSYAAKITLGYDYLQDKAIRWYWSDNALHDAFSNANGQITYVGPGDIDETTTTMVRGQYVRLYAHNGGAVYLGYSGSTAVTSDRNMKTDIVDIDDRYLEFFDKLHPITYKYDAPGNKGHRDHVGFIAQEVEEALIASGLTTEEFAGLIIENDVVLNPNYDTSLTAEENATKETHYDTLYSLRYEEFISLLVKKVQSLQEQINQLKGD